MKKLVLTKHQSRDSERVRRFLKILERWAVHVSLLGYNVDSVPIPGPGDMSWVAVKRTRPVRNEAFSFSKN